MRGLMMERPLLISGLLEHAAAVHGDREVVSYAPEEPVHRGCYRATAERVRQLAGALRTLGVGSGDRVATLACSTHRHLEIFYAASGIGAICHTVNPRLHADQVAWILNHAADALVFVDLAFLPQAEAALRGSERLRHVVVMTDRAHMPAALPGPLSCALCYEELLARGNGRIDWPQFDENAAAALCYTSGTTGDPKGVLYSHRSQILHAFAVALPDVAGLSEADSVLPAAPMFHVNAWGIPYAAALTGARLVLPGPRLHGAALAELIEGEGVTSGQRLSTLKRVIVGGAACPRTMIEAFQDEFGIEVRHAWGMTEMSPLGSIGTLKGKHQNLPADERVRLQAKQGRPVFGVEIKIVDEDGRDLPQDGCSIGEIMVRGPWVCRGYYLSEDAGSRATDGWFATGDVGSIDADGYLQITDRRKDLIKCAGEWISSMEIESLATEHPAVMQAAVIGTPDEKWGERPVLIVVPLPESNVSEREILALYDARVAKWCVPVRIILVESLPVSGTGKVQKNTLRALYAPARPRRCT
jgi:acyl-CoA synthetase (AMP-forming)/AMP-acid ligase II